jgi:hexokinase
MQGKPDQISSFVIKNMQYEANKIVSPQTLQPIMQNYLANILEENNASELEEERKLRFIKDTYKVDGIEAYELASVLRDPKQENMRATFQSYEQDLIIEELIEEFEALKKLSSTILENAKKYAQTGSEDSFERVYKSTLPFTDFAPVRTIYNLKEFVYNNYKSLSKSVSSANSLFTAASEAYQKVQSALNPSRDKDGVKPRSWFDMYNSPEEMRENRNLYSPLYPGSRPPEQ